jgi:hypothetical protein
MFLPSLTNISEKASLITEAMRSCLRVSINLKISAKVKII